MPMLVLDRNVRCISDSGSWLKRPHSGEYWERERLNFQPSESDISLSAPASLWISLLIDPENRWSGVLTMVLWHMGYQRRRRQATPHCLPLHPTTTLSAAHSTPWRRSAWCLREARQMFVEWIPDSRLAGANALWQKGAQCNCGTERNSVRET